MRLLIATIAAVGFIGAAAAVTSDSDRRASGVSTAKGLPSEPSHYQVVMAGQETSCSVAKGNAVSDDLTELVVDKTCSAVMPGLEQVRYWREGDDGSVIFAKADGDALVEFSVADGVAYETFRPDAPLVSLIAMK